MSSTQTRPGGAPCDDGVLKFNSIRPLALTGTSHSYFRHWFGNSSHPATNCRATSSFTVFKSVPGWITRSTILVWLVALAQNSK